MIHHSLVRSLPLLCSGLLLLPAAALAQTAPAAAAPSAPAAAPASAPLGSAANPIVVPAGCSAATQNGQVVVICPPAGAAPAPAPSVAATSQPQVVVVTTPPPPYSAAPVREESKWYGWQNLTVDGATVVSTIAVAPASGSAAATVFWSGYLLGGPIVHWANGQVGKGFASLGIRVGAPLTLGVAGALIGSTGGTSGDWDEFGGAYLGAAIGLLAGYATAVALDAALLARKTVKVTPEAEQRSRNKLKWSPSAGYDPKQRSFSVGVGGTF